MFYKKKIGNNGEDLATKYLKKNKYKILDRNFNSKCGEIDIIASKNEYIVFVEVKTRTQGIYGSAAEAVDYRKQQKIIKTSMFYLGEKFNLTPVRYDVIEVYIDNDDYRINHIENAFGG